MAYQIISPRQSFVQFNESDLVTSCELADVHLCLPVYDEDDAWFQFIVQADTDEEADALCDLENALISLGLVEDCGDEVAILFDEKPERFRISGQQVLFNWQHGLPGFAGAFSVGDCFHVVVLLDDEVLGCSNCFQRINDDCHTSVVEYGNDDNFAGFNYCNSEPVNTDETVCDPTMIEFGPVSSLALTYTTSLQNKHGNFPSVEVWGYVGSELVRMPGIEVKFDGYPPTQINFDFGGTLSGVIKLRK